MFKKNISNINISMGVAADLAFQTCQCKDANN